MLSMEQLEGRLLPSILLGAGGAKSAAFSNAAGQLVKLSLSGGGSGVLTLIGDAANRADMDRIVIADSTARTKLTIKAAPSATIAGLIDIRGVGIGLLSIGGTFSGVVRSQASIASLKATSMNGALVATASRIDHQAEHHRQHDPGWGGHWLTEYSATPTT